MFKVVIVFKSNTQKKFISLELDRFPTREEAFFDLCREAEICLQLEAKEKDCFQVLASTGLIKYGMLSAVLPPSPNTDKIFIYRNGIFFCAFAISHILN